MINMITSLSQYSILLITISSCLFIKMSSGISVKRTDFQKYIEKSCYRADRMGMNSLVLGQETPQGQSMENFISLIEKIEDSSVRTVSLLRPDILARLILSRFHIDEYDYFFDYYTGDFQQEERARHRSEINGYLLREVEERPQFDFPEDPNVLNENEKCSMYFMLSHHINRTALNSDARVYNTVFKSPPSASRSRPGGARPFSQGPLYRQVRMTEEPREYGVVSFRNHETHAIAPARVLAGIVAAGMGTAEMSVGEVLSGGRLGPYQDDIISGLRADSKIDILTAVTLADIWAFGVAPIQDNIQNSQRFGASGRWNDSICQVEYKLNRNVSRGSLAEIRGGIDGYILGRRVKEVLASGSEFKLSSLLRQYYSPTGLFDEFTSVCRRNSQTEIVGKLKDQVKNYMQAYLPYTQKKSIDDNKINAMVDGTNTEWTRAIQQAMQPIPEDQQWCDTSRSDSSPKNARCETPSDVTLMVDLDNEIDEQMKIVTKLSNELDLRRHGSSMSIVANTKGGFFAFDDQTNTDGLSRIAWNSTNRGCVTCRLAWADKSSFGNSVRNQPDVLFLAINATLRDLKKGRPDAVLTPSKPFVFMNFGFFKKPGGDTRRFYSAKNDLWWYHRDSPLIMVGRGNALDMKEIAYDKDRDVYEASAPDSTGLVEQINKRICETPALIRAPKCNVQASDNDFFTGYVTPGRKQYFAMYPEFFLKSFNVEFKFEAITGPIKICYRRGTPKPEEDERNCQNLKPGESELVYRSKNPCYKYTLSDCWPFYFTVIGVNEGAAPSTGKCKKDACLNMDQIEFKLTHSGVQCSSAIRIMSPSIALPFVTIISLVLIKFGIKI